MLQEWSRWLRSRKSEPRVKTQKGHSARLGVETLEARDLPSGSYPGFSLSDGTLSYNSQVIDTGVQSFVVVNNEVFDLHSNGVSESMNSNGSDMTTLTNYVTFADNNGTTGVAYLTTDGVICLDAPNGPGWVIPEGSGTTQLVQVTDNEGRSAAAWLQNGTIYFYNEYNLAAGGDIITLANGVSQIATFADNNSTTGVAYLTTGGVVCLDAPNGPGWIVPEGSGTTELVQVTDSEGRPAAAWLQNGTLYFYNEFNLAAGGDIIVLAQGVSQIATYTDHNNTTSLAYLQGSTVYTMAPNNPNFWPVPHPGSSALAQGYDTAGRPAAVWLEKGTLYFFNVDNELPGGDVMSSATQLSPDGSIYGLDPAGELWRYTTASGLVQIGSNVTSFQVASDASVYALNTSNAINLYTPNAGVFTQIGSNVTSFQVASDASVYALNTSNELYRYTISSGLFTLLDTDVKSFIAFNDGVADLHSDGVYEIMNSDGSGVTILNQVVTFADNNGTTGIAYLTASGVLNLLAPNGPGWVVPEGSGTTQLVQVTDSEGRPAAAWLQNGTLYFYNEFNLAAGGDIIVLAQGVSQIATFADQNNTTSLAYIEGSTVYTVEPNNPNFWPVPHTGSSALAQGYDTAGRPAAVWLENGTLYFFNVDNERPGGDVMSSVAQSSPDGSMYALDPAGELWRYTTADGLVQIGSNVTSFQIASDSSVYALNTVNALYRYTSSSGVFTLLDTNVESFIAFDTGVADLHSDGVYEIMNSDGSGVTVLNQVVTFADNNGTTGIAYLTASGVLNLLAPNGPGWVVPEGSGTTQLVQVTDSEGRPAAAWLQNGTLYFYNEFNLAAGGDIITLAQDVSQIASFADQNNTTGLAYLTSSGEMYLLSSSGHLAGEGSGTTSLAQGFDANGLPVAVWWQDGQLELYSALHGTTNSSGATGYGPAAASSQPSLDGSKYAVDQVGELWRYTTANGLVQIGSNVTSFQVSLDDSVYALNTDNALYRYTTSSGVFTQIGSDVTSFQVASDASVYAENADFELYCYIPSNGSFTQVASGIASFQVAPDASVYALNIFKELNRYFSSGDDTQIARSITSFQVAANASVYALNDDNSFYCYTPSSGTFIQIGSNISSFQIALNGDVYAVTADGELGQYTSGSNSGQTIMEQVTDYQVMPDGSVYGYCGNLGILYRYTSADGTVEIGSNLQSFELSADGIVFVSTLTGNLYQWAPRDGGNVQNGVLVDSNVLEFALDNQGGVYVLGSNGNLWDEQAGWQQDGRTLIASGITMFTLDGKGGVFALDSYGNLWDDQDGKQTLFDSYVQTFAPDGHGGVYVLSTNNNLWDEQTGWQQNGRTLVDSDVYMFAPDGRGGMYVLFTAGYLTFAQAGQLLDVQGGNQTLIDSYVQTFAPDGHGGVYVLDINGNLWDMQGGNQTLIDSYVQTFAPDGHGGVYVLGGSGNLWDEQAGWQQTGRVWIDGNVQQFAPNGQGSLYVLGGGNNLWVECAGWQQNGRTLVSSNVASFGFTGTNLDIQNTKGIWEDVLIGVEIVGTLVVTYFTGGATESLLEVVVEAAAEDAIEQGLNMALYGGSFSWSQLGTSVVNGMIASGVNVDDLTSALENITGEDLATVAIELDNMTGGSISELLPVLNDLADGNLVDVASALIDASSVDLGQVATVLSGLANNNLEEVAEALSNVAGVNLDQVAVALDGITGVNLGQVADALDGLTGVNLGQVAGALDSVTGVDLGQVANALDGITGVNLGQVANALDGITGVNLGQVAGALDGVTGVDLGQVANALDGITGVNLGQVANALDSVTGVDLGQVANALDGITGVNLGQVAGALDSVTGVDLGQVAGALDGITGVDLGQVAGALDNVTGVDLGQVANALDNITGVNLNQVAGALDGITGVNLNQVAGALDSITGVSLPQVVDALDGIDGINLSQVASALINGVDGPSYSSIANALSGIANGNLNSIAEQLLTLPGAPSITTTALTNWNLTESGYSETIGATGGVGTLSYNIPTGNALPAGLTLNPLTGVISGTPAASGTTTFKVVVTDGVSVSVTQALSLTIPQFTPDVSVVVESGSYNDLPYAASGTVTGIGGVNLGAPTFTYYAGTSVSGTPLAGPPVTVRTYTVVASYPGGQIYTAAQSAPATITISPAFPTINLIGGTFTYNGSTQAPTAALLGAAGVNLGTPTLTYYSGTKASGKPLSNAPVNVGTYTVVASFSGNQNMYRAPSSTAIITITKATPTVSVQGGTFTFDGLMQKASGSVIGVNGISLGTPTFAYYAGNNASGIPLSAPVNAGIYTVVASYGGSQSYNSARSLPATIVINKVTSVFSDLLSPTIMAGTSSVMLSGVLTAGEAVSTGKVTITINGVSVQASLSRSGLFTVKVPTKGLAIGSYTINFNYMGGGNFNGTTGTVTLEVI